MRTASSSSTSTAPPPHRLLLPAVALLAVLLLLPSSPPAALPSNGCVRVVIAHLFSSVSGLLLGSSLLVEAVGEGEDDETCDSDLAGDRGDDEKASSGSNKGDGTDEDLEYLIIGAGGSGLQMALCLEKYNCTHPVLEKNSVAGSFWTKFPRFRELISVNKRIRNETQSWRCDWHSFLEAPLRMRDVLIEHFPTGQDWHEHMRRVAEMANLNIEYNVEVERIDSDKPCVYGEAGENGDDAGPKRRCAKRRVFVSTGLREKSERLIRAIGGIPYSQITREDCDQKIVCIMGNGNAAFETAQNVFDIAQSVIMYGKSPFRLSSVTRYTGDVRVKSLQVVENLHG